MRSPRYTILIANRKTGAIRRLTASRRVLGLVLTAVLATPLVVALGSRGADVGELDALRVANETLLQENQSYREATGELTSQIASLQTALTELGEEGQLDAATKRALDKLPLSIRSQAVGGPAMSDLKASGPVPSATPEGTFGILRDLLGTIENGLVSVRSRIEAQKALARATPSVWPIVGRWTYSSPFGPRKDPFTGEPDFHPGIDISANVGVPVRATADGTVEAAAFDGAYGNAVVLAHGFTISTRYGHLSRFSVRPGQTVKRGDVIGYVGATGRVTSSHLHYEILFNGSRISPLTLLGGR
jgi:murein DD-endopeptidase MepM/ murein hydrolase activator NlpD